jgi:hypothetical protein
VGFHNTKHHKKTMQKKRVLFIENFRSLQSFVKAKLNKTNLFINFKTTIIVSHGLLPWFYVDWFYVFTIYAFVCQLWNVHLITLEFNPQNPPNQPSTKWSWSELAKKKVMAKIARNHDQKTSKAITTKNKI